MDQHDKLWKAVETKRTRWLELIKSEPVSDAAHVIWARTCYEAKKEFEQAMADFQAFVASCKEGS